MRTEHADEAAPVLIVPGGTSNSAAEFLAELQTVVCAGPSSIVVDVSRLDTIPSPVLSALAGARRSFLRHGGQLLICNPSRRAMRQLDGLGFRQVFRAAPASEMETSSSTGRHASGGR